MAGIGDNKKGGKFTLKSGNTPSFQEMGSSPLKIIPGLKKKGTEGTKWTDKVKAFGKAITSEEGGMAPHYGLNKAMRMYKGLKAQYRRERAAKEAAKNKKSPAKNYKKGYYGVK